MYQRVFWVMGVLVSMFIISSCDQPELSIVETRSKRVQYIKQLVAQQSKLPSDIVDANYIEFQQGDGKLGPSDFSFYLRITVKKGNTKKWVDGLAKPFNNSIEYSKIPDGQSWWLNKIEFTGLQLYETKTFFNRYNGWMCIDEKNGYVYVYTFTQ